MVGDGRFRLLVKGINPVTSPQTLQNYFEVMSKENVDDLILFSADHTRALITMDKKPGLWQAVKCVCLDKLGFYSPFDSI